MDKFEARQRDLVAGARWVIDGNYNSTLHVRLEAADTVIFMDLPTRSCLRGTLIHRRLWFTTVCWALQQSPCAQVVLARRRLANSGFLIAVVP
jgi:adenylate kinase family enzyme